MIKQNCKKAYVLITPARNEEGYIEMTIKSVVSQTVLPKKWVIVSDGSTDRTEEIVSSYLEKYKFIQLVRTPGENKRNFGSKVDAFNAGYEKVKDIEHDFIGNLDADVSFEPNYFENIINKFEENNKLGIAGGHILELDGGKFRKYKYNLASVAGAVQLFKKQCYQEIGGYCSLECGGIDAIAEVMTRMKGWQIKTFPEIEVKHHRRIGVTQENIMSKWFHYGIKENLIGAHPIFMFAKCIHRFKEKPYIIGGLIMMCGYLCSLVRRDTRQVSREVFQYLRSEQKKRLYKPFLSLKEKCRF